MYMHAISALFWNLSLVAVEYIHQEYVNHTREAYEYTGANDAIQQWG